MPFYHQLGEIPAKKHTTFYKKDGKSLYREELVSALGFSSVYSNRYHVHMPTEVVKIEEWQPRETLAKVEWKEAMVQPYHFSTDEKKTTGNFITARHCYLHNANCRLSIAHVTEQTPLFFRNAYFHEVVFVHYGSGSFLSEFGKIDFKPWDQIVIPKGTIYQFQFQDLKKVKLVIVESDTPYDIPKHFRNEYGQLTEDAPYCERDLKRPEFMTAKDEKGEFPLILKTGERFFQYTLSHHPFDVVGWDGYLYPFAFNMRDYNPKVGKLHLPPPVHLVFTTRHFVYCNFCERPYDFHPQSIPAPYVHYNIDSDEVLYYVEGEFMSRKGVSEGSVTLHPTGLPHGPQPGKTEESVGKKETSEFALMVDTFSPLFVTTNVRDSMDRNYFRSWVEGL